MVYNFKEYKSIFDTPMKKQQELAIARKIMDLLNRNKYDDLDEFINKNGNYQDFIKNNNLQNVMKHFGNTLKEPDYIKILENLRILTKTKQNFEKDTIKTSNIGNKQFNSFEGKDKTYFIDNSRTDKPIEKQMKDLQSTEQNFQTTDPKQNTENMFKELERKKEGLELSYLYEINFDSLNIEEKELYQNAYSYQQSIDGVIRIDLEKGIIVDAQNNIMKIEKNNGQYCIVNSEDGFEKTTTQEKTYHKQKTLAPNPNTIYSN